MELKTNQKFNWQMRYLTFLLLVFITTIQVFAHGGEDHGGEKPKVVTTTKGSILQSVRLGEYELTFKTPTLEPNVRASANLFITKYETNEALENAKLVMEIESTNGTLSPIKLDKGQVSGGYNLEIPPLEEGKYVIRTTLESSKGRDTAMFTGLEVTHQVKAENEATGSITSKLGSVLFYSISIFFLVSFTVLFFFIWRMAKDEGQTNGETVSI